MHCTATAIICIQEVDQLIDRVKFVLLLWRCLINFEPAVKTFLIFKPNAITKKLLFSSCTSCCSLEPFNKSKYVFGKCQAPLIIAAVVHELHKPQDRLMRFVPRLVYMCSCRCKVTARQCFLRGEGNQTPGHACISHAFIILSGSHRVAPLGDRSSLLLLCLCLSAG